MSPAVSPVALLRFAVLSEVRALVLRGALLREAIMEVAAREHVGPQGKPYRASVRTIYRWLAASRGGGLEGLAPLPRSSTCSLDPALITFLRTEKQDDPRASIPQLLRRAVLAGLLERPESVDRTTVWRALTRLGVPTRCGAPPPPDQRRFAKENRLQIVLCDGKHFRAGPQRLRRVALFFIDDATRFVPQVVVGPSESALLFLRGFHLLLGRVGKMDMVYFDHGSAFIADDSHAVLARLDIAYVHGTKGYPQGRGKIERFNRTAQEEILRDLTRESVDPDCVSLELRLAHFLDGYNQSPHESLQKQTPKKLFDEDDRPLQRYLDPAALRADFSVQEERRVTNDHVISLDGVLYEVPRGLAGQRIVVHRDVLEPDHILLDHQGRSIRLHPVDLHANARARRGVTSPIPEKLPPAGASSRASEAALRPITQADGGFSDLNDQETSWI